MSDDYKLLNLGGLTSLVTNFRVLYWGNEFVLECLYDPTGKSLPYSLNFKDCREIRWEVHDPEEVGEPFAELIGIHLGEDSRLASSQDNCHKPALIHTDIFEISLLYSSFNIERGQHSAEIEQSKPLVGA